jgi:hypothetical protein
VPALPQRKRPDERPFLKTGISTRKSHIYLTIRGDDYCHAFDHNGVTVILDRCGKVGSRIRV